MPSCADIKVTPASLKLETARTGKFIVTATNAVRRPFSASAYVKVEGQTQPAWVKTDVSRFELDADKTQSIEIAVTVPPDAPPGKYTFHVQIVDVGNPDEFYGNSESLSVEVPQAAPVEGGWLKKNWWLLAIIGGVVLIGGGVAIALAARSGPRPQPPPPEPPPGLPALESDVDRPGGDFSSFDLADARPEACQSACVVNKSCVAFTFVRPGFQGASARCWLKSAAPVPGPSPCCVSGLSGNTPPMPPALPALEPGVDRPGLDLNSFNLGAPSPEECQKACLAAPGCKAFTYVRPGVQGPTPRCWLKSGVPAAVRNDCCTSGLR